VEQQALSQPAKGFDFSGIDLCERCNVGGKEMKKAVQNRQASFSVGRS
jgi:hypothetical protein